MRIPRHLLGRDPEITAAMRRLMPPGLTAGTEYDPNERRFQPYIERQRRRKALGLTGPAATMPRQRSFVGGQWNG